MIVNIAPSCKCSECILYPVSSHGIHMIGVYRPATLLRSRGSVLPEAVRVVMRDGCERWSVTPLPEHLCDGTQISIR